jgi:hypothetical protein
LKRQPDYGQKKRKIKAVVAHAEPALDSRPAVRRMSIDLWPSRYCIK